jgi:hypothetical protein
MVPDEWKRWLAENEFLSVDDSLIVQRLVDEGMDRREVDAELSELRSHPSYDASIWIAQKLKKLESVLSVKREVSRLVRGALRL